MESEKREEKRGKGREGENGNTFCDGFIQYE